MNSEQTANSLNPKRTRRAWPDGDRDTRIPYWVYSDPEVFRREIDVIFRGKTWSYVGLDAEVPNPGDFKRSWIGTRPVILTRDKDGQINVVENRCAHRGARVCWESRGNSDSLICPYHQWSYDLKGNLTGVPFTRGVMGNGGMPKDFDRSEHGLRKLRVHNEGGMVLATFSEETPEFEAYCGPKIYPYVRREFPGKPLKVLGYNRQLITCNWKLYFENLKDPYHATLLHAFFITFGLWRADAESACISSDDGCHGVMTSRNRRVGENEATAEMGRLKSKFDLLDQDTITPRPEFEDGKVVGTTLFPSVVLQQQANTLATRHIVPKSHDQMELTWTFFGYEDDDEDMLRRRLRHANLMGPAGYVSMDDSEVLNQNQIGADSCPDDQALIEMGGRDFADTDHMVSEVLIRSFYRYYRDVMGF